MLRKPSLRACSAAAIALLSLVVLGLFACYVWPTFYRYDHFQFHEVTFPVRIHRVTGRAEMLSPQAGWYEMKEKEDPSRDGRQR
jgi:hypothetical protein